MQRYSKNISKHNSEKHERQFEIKQYDLSQDCEGDSLQTNQ